MKSPVRLVRVWLVIAGCLLPLEQSNATPMFMGLGDLPGGDTRGYGNNISADGRVVVGQGHSGSGTEAFRWSSVGGITGLGDLPGGPFSSVAQGVSGDGRVVVGSSFTSSGQRAFRWTVENGMQPLGTNAVQAWGASSDGSVIAGITTENEAFRWTVTDGIAGIGDLPGGIFNSLAFDLSLTGDTIVGSSFSSQGREAFRWTAEGGMVGLGDLQGGVFASQALGVSADGLVVVGRGNYRGGTQEAFRWDITSGMVGLGDFPGGILESVAFDVSADGQVIVGSGTSGTGTRAFVWDQTNGMRNLQEVLTSDFGLNLNGWVLQEAFGVSADGLTITGYGTNPSGQTEAWIATIPEPSTALLLSLGLVGMAAKRRRSLCS